jgi:dTDP-4-dehydrorhamnose reductase
MENAKELNPRTVWITGAGGLIGSCLVRAATASALGWRVRQIIRQEIDLTDFRAARQLFQRERPALVIHCAALSSSVACQESPALARKLNVEVTAVLAELASDVPFIFFSTDLVFDGRDGNYDESAQVNPLSVYGETKVEAERIVLANPRHAVIRTSLNGGTSPTGDRGFNEQMRHAWQAGKTLRLFTDEFRSPVSAVVTARVIWEFANQNQTGLFHVAGSERLSRWRIGQLIAARWPQLNPKIEAASLKEFPGAPRSPDTSLNCSKAQRTLPFRLPGLAEWLAAHPDEPF